MRQEAMTWWTNIKPEERHRLTVFHHGERHYTSLTGREIENIFTSFHSQSKSSNMAAHLLDDEEPGGETPPPPPDGGDNPKPQLPPKPPGKA